MKNLEKLKVNYKVSPKKTKTQIKVEEETAPMIRREGRLGDINFDINNSKEYLGEIGIMGILCGCSL